MQAYATDLRRRVVDAVEAGMPRAEAARVFQVSVATSKRYRKRRRETGALAPGRSPGRPPEVAARPDDTLAQHAATWRAASGEALSIWAVRRALARAGITRNKSRCAPSSATRRPSPRPTWSSSTRRRPTSP